MKRKQNAVQKKNQTQVIAKPKRQYAKRLKKSKDKGPLTTFYLPIMNKKIQTRKTWPVKIELDSDVEGQLN